MDFKRIVICKKLFVREKLSTVREFIYFTHLTADVKF